MKKEPNRSVKTIVENKKRMDGGSPNRADQPCGSTGHAGVPDHRWHRLPAATQNMMIDTGSNMSSVHFSTPNDSVLFDPVKSSTYALFSCASAPCTQLGEDGNGCSSSQCQYVVTYGDDSNTTGTYGSDTLALTTSKTTAATYGKTFPYLLPETSRSLGFLTLGMPNSMSVFVMTPMFKYKNMSNFYTILLEDIAVGGRLLDISLTIFIGGSVIDSGTIIRQLPTRAYSALSWRFKAGMMKYLMASPANILDTCFDFTELDNFSFPSVALVFNGGTVVDLVYNRIMVALDEATECIAFAATSSLSIIGTVQQRTFEVLHDVGKGASSGSVRTRADYLGGLHRPHVCRL
ncbi:hypothetical protein QYE76_025281 [Lolium multiflorum]|uniref:Peptidase A1 domain-containing protein n=1 Tax=Lolium multiflorum TaxID=4521 RepID=A0AAD8RGJ0_LOLMU|nr:hypothetical protein QYE76_025281 [Lolium multiflorum]